MQEVLMTTIDYKLSEADIIYYNLVQSLNSSHGGLDVEALHVLPVLLQQRDQEVHGQVDILGKLFLSHLDMTNSNIEAENLLHLELDG